MNLIGQFFWLVHRDRLQSCKVVLKPLQAACIRRLRCITRLLQLAMDFFLTLRDKLQGKLHHVTIALGPVYSVTNDKQKEKVS